MRYWKKFLFFLSLGLGFWKYSSGGKTRWIAFGYSISGFHILFFNVVHWTGFLTESPLPWGGLGGIKSGGAPGSTLCSYRKDCEKTPSCSSSSSSSSSLLEPWPPAGKRALAERSPDVLHSTELVRMGGGAAASTLLGASVSLSPTRSPGTARPFRAWGPVSSGEVPGPAGRSCLSIQAL